MTRPAKTAYRCIHAEPVIGSENLFTCLHPASLRGGAPPMVYWHCARRCHRFEPGGNGPRINMDDQMNLFDDAPATPAQLALLRDKVNQCIDNMAID